MSQARILIATASPIWRSRLKKGLSSQTGLSVVAHSKDLTETYNAAETLRPNLVLIARNLTIPPEFEVMKALFRAMDIRWIEVEDGVGQSDRTSAASGLFSIDSEIAMNNVVAQIRAVCRPARSAYQPNPQVQRYTEQGSEKLVLIGASTGGVDALIDILSCYPKDCPPTAIVQHTGSRFLESLIRLLDRQCAASVVAGKDGFLLERGTVCVAARSDAHLGFQKQLPLRVKYAVKPPVSGHLPSVDAMFTSALPIARKVVGVLLTGMGSDGAEGLLQLRNHGARTIAQDESSSVVYGMPQVAWKKGAVEQQLNIRQIGPAILKACSSNAVAQV